MSISGHCLCGNVSYSTESSPVYSGNCHCVDCKRTSGGAYAATMFFQEQELSIQGEVKYFESMGGSGQSILRGFCPECGSSLFGKPATRPGLIGVRAGTLNDLSHYKPQANIFMSHAPEWDVIDPAVPGFATMMPRK